MKIEMLKELSKNYNVGDVLYLTSKNFLWVIEKLENGYFLKVKGRDRAFSSYNSNLEGIYENVELLEKIIYERINSFEFVEFN